MRTFILGAATAAILAPAALAGQVVLVSSLREVNVSLEVIPTHGGDPVFDKDAESTTEPGPWMATAEVEVLFQEALAKQDTTISMEDGLLVTGMGSVLYVSNPLSINMVTGQSRLFLEVRVCTTSNLVLTGLIGGNTSGSKNPATVSVTITGNDGAIVQQSVVLDDEGGRSLELNTQIQIPPGDYTAEFLVDAPCVDCVNKFAGAFFEDISFSITPIDVCLGDLSGDGQVGPLALGILLAQWGGSGLGDLNCDGTVDAADLGILLSQWGPCQ